ncbi:MAG: CHAT domain-containing protein [Phenylobacterium sp.]|uniref:CHAT domain-containing protein n=1 Tax=Phenylobacterium sp. TaxID=1871053 RepID=UPI0012238107|nr:CHAT domain-containing protein [Phenylobacterium sp.]TAL31447.1 MAG: CHAT domain-containing protein [Phenylobacterium sp.]
MGRGGVTRLWAAAGAAVVSGVLAASPDVARAALTDDLCLPSGDVTLPTYPSAGALQQAAEMAESRLARRGAADPFAEIAPSLELRGSGPERPSPLAIAEYCSAAGELMRVSAQGSQLQAQTYLLGAFQTASRANLRGPASMAAYRLGLVSLSGTPATGTRGGGRRASRGPSEAAREVGQLGDDPCVALMRTSFVVSSSLSLSVASLGCAAQQAHANEDHRTAALAELRLARLRLSVAETNAAAAAEFRREAVGVAAHGMADARKIQDPTLRAELLGRLLSAYLDAGGPLDGMSGVTAAMRVSSAPAAQAYATALDARMAAANGDANAARQMMDQALLLEAQRSLPARLPEFHLLLSEFDPANREAHVLAAYEALEAIRPLLPRFDPLTEETAFSLYMRRVFQGAVDVQLAGAADAGAAIRVKSAQQILEAYRQAELQSVFGSECIPARDPLKPEALRPGEVLLYPILLPDRLEMLYVAGGQAGAEFRRLPPNRSVNRQDVARLVEAAVVSLSGGEDDSWRAASRQLYDILIKPIEAELTPGSLLAVVPDGALRSLPFSVLIDSQNRYLVEKTRVTIAPALAYSQAGGIQAQNQQLVAASLEMEVRVPAGRFEKLDGTGAEARLAAVTDGKRIQRSWVIENFSKADLVGALTREQVDVLHLATHASFNGRSDRAFIVANGEVILLSELRQILSANRTRGGELDLLILSACETAVGDDEASMGLAGAAVQAGARSAIASLWPVSDAGTAELMKSFYGRYREGRSKSEALREAQLSLIAQGGDLANPNIWAAFTLLGAWR